MELNEMELKEKENENRPAIQAEKKKATSTKTSSKLLEEDSTNHAQGRTKEKAGTKKSAAVKTTKKPAKKSTKKTSATAASKKSAKSGVVDNSGRTLLIVESPTKVHTIEQFLGPEYRILASQGHVRDLPAKKLGVEVEDGFLPQYVNLPDRKDIIKRIKEEAKTSDGILLATDPDREGEAISWHIAQVLGMDSRENCRITFNEITKSAVNEALKHPRPVDMNLVNAQQARRIMDRLVGYKISPILWKKVRKGLSAGRVQSVAVRIICDRDREIAAFVPSEYWVISALMQESASNAQFSAKLEKVDGKKAEIQNEQQAQSIVERCTGKEYTITKVKNGQKLRRPQAPFTTSTMQQEASRKLSMSPAVTMRVAQSLYEGVTIPGEGAVGLITYLRTDSVRVSEEAQAQVRSYIAQRYGEAYLPKKPNVYRNKRSAQDAHEAIHPTSVTRTPESLKGILTRDQQRLYELIFNRFVASQMMPEVSDTVTADIEGEGLLFRTTGAVVKFDGYRKVYVEGRDEEEEKQQALPILTEGTPCALLKVDSKQKFTQPPAHYTEATLVSGLEERGIGRPSTYASIISTIIDREYVQRQGRQLIATELGFLVTDLLVDHFSDIVDVEFTANMESQLDAVEEGGDWQKTVEEFYTPFSKTLEAAANIERRKLPEEVTDIPCENCGAMMVIRSGRFGKFLACPNYPECKTTKPLVEKTGTHCPKCHKDIVKKRSRKGKLFYGCSGYPECDFVSWDLPLDEKCEKCGTYMVQRWDRNRRPYRQCANPECGNRIFQNANKTQVKETSDAAE